MASVDIEELKIFRGPNEARIAKVASIVDVLTESIQLIPPPKHNLETILCFFISERQWRPQMNFCKLLKTLTMKSPPKTTYYSQPDYIALCDCGFHFAVFMNFIEDINLIIKSRQISPQESSDIGNKMDGFLDTLLSSHQALSVAFPLENEKGILEKLYQSDALKILCFVLVGYLARIQQECKPSVPIKPQSPHLRQVQQIQQKQQSSITTHGMSVEKYDHFSKVISGFASSPIPQKHALMIKTLFLSTTQTIVRIGNTKKIVETLWLSALADAEYNLKMFHKALKHYIESAAVETNFFTSSTQTRIFDFSIHRVISCLSHLEANMAAAVLCQFSQPVNFAKCFKLIQKISIAQLSLGSDDLPFYSCIYEIPILELLLTIFNTKVTNKKKFSLLSLIISSPSVNESNCAEYRNALVTSLKMQTLRKIAQRYT
eukprot:TRINITY_DN20246_c0_g1_i1.p1 TRINITY_DN20246_c0_g1~~TRINITY_DN20246_c0_g1_i1.p1  ORF type:complete len:502 (+),score=139.64 TRINITY_DN20246_c0_g1_i1:211-1506(+)